MTWPFENDTGAIIKKLAGRSMKADRRSRAFLILAIALSVCMACSIILISAGAQEEFKNTQRNKAQIAMIGITDGQLSALRQSKDVQWAEEYAAIGLFYSGNETVTVAYGSEDYFTHQEEKSIQSRAPDGSTFAIDAAVTGVYSTADLMARSPVVPGSPYFMMTYDMAKKLTGITEQTGVLSISAAPGKFDEVLGAVQEIAEQNGKILVDTIEQTVKNIRYRYSAPIKALYMAAGILFTFGSISLMNMLMVDFQNRKREFGLLEAAGATRKQLTAMLRRKIGVYLGGSLAVSLVLGAAVSFAACYRLDAVNHCITLKLPWPFLAELIAAMTVIYLIFTAYAGAELKKTGILSAIREE